MTLSAKKRRIVLFIRDFRNGRGYAPTLEEIATEMGVSKITIYEHVSTLVVRGLLTKEPYKQRSLAVVPAALAEAGL